jgi:putative tryptophan/tyrosine transport system substrate-binding protein
VPSLSKPGALWDSAIGEAQFRATQAAAHAAGVALQSLPIRGPEDFKGAFDRATRQQIDGVIILSSPLILEQRSQIVEWAIKARLPTISLVTLFPSSGVLMAYGPSLPDMYKRAATYVDRILRGAKAADLPIERPTRFRLVINVKTAKAIGIEIPPIMLARADEVIE